MPEQGFQRRAAGRVEKMKDKMIMISQKDWDYQQKKLKSNNDELLAFNNQSIIGLMPKGQLAKLKTIITKYIELEEVDHQKDTIE